MSNPACTSPATPDLILANPYAGGGFARKSIPRLQRFAAQRGWNAEFRSAGSVAEFTQIAQAEASQGRTRIFAFGGDGTFQALLNALAQCPGVSIGILPAGGGNDLAMALGLPRDPIRAAEAILSHGELRALDAARVRTADGSQRLYMGGGGVGLDAEAAHFASGVYRNLPGRSRYLCSAIRALASFHAPEVRVSFGAAGHEDTIAGHALVLGILNTPSYGAGLRLAPGANLQDGRLDLVMLEDLSLMEIVKVLPSLAYSGELRTQRIQRFVVEQARIETDRLCWFHADGEIIGQTPVEIAVVPRAKRVWCVARSAQSTKSMMAPS